MDPNTHPTAPLPFPELADAPPLEVIHPPKGAPVHQKSSAPVFGLGGLADGDEDPLLPIMGEAQAAYDADIVPSMREHPSIVVGGVRIRPVSLSSLAMLQEVNSPFVNFIAILSPTERLRLQKLVKRKLNAVNGVTLEDARKSMVEGDPEPNPDDFVPITEEEEKEIDDLAAKARQENAQFKNITLSILVFFAIHDLDTPDADIERMVFDDRAALRSHALAIGRRIEIGDFEALGKEIGQAIQDAKKTKVHPIPKDKAAKKPGNG